MSSSLFQKFVKPYTYIKGFTLLETIVSVGILALVIVGPLAVIMNSNSYARQTKDSMIATYLAEEAVELLQNQYDTLYILCKKDPLNSLCTPAIVNETAGQIAWRVFKERMGSVGGEQSCYLNLEGGGFDNTLGCSYDFVHFSDDITVNPTRYIATASECSALVEVATSTVDGIRHMYVCRGEPAHHLNGTTTSKEFIRTITMEWMPTFETGPLRSDHYNDDIRVVSTVKYRGFNGYITTVSVTRFMHSRP
jgi:type II secretory pathway pseudopilin PulG